jgi:nuclear pore complex protein Nup133
MSTSPAPESIASEQRALRGASIRNPRRRQRNDSDGGTRTAPRRKRSKISQDAFVPRDGSHEDETHSQTPHMNGHAHTGVAKSARKLSGAYRDATPQHTDAELVVRGGKKSTVKRATRGDGAQLLTQNANYTVKSLPSTPRALKRAGVEFRGSLATHTGQALAVTREQAYVWEYGSHAPVTNPRVFDLPFLARDSEPVPFGALVTNGISTDTGLVLISATTGQVVFHESIERAASMGLFQERKPGVEGTIGNIFSGEHISNVTSADSAGFIITFTSGRIAQLTLRDIQGKPRIEAQFLRENSQEKSSWSATFIGLLSASAWRLDVAAVHTRALGPRGQMQIIAATENGVIKIWNLDWSGRADHRGNIDFRDEFAREIKATQSAETHGYVDQIALMDFAIVEQAQESAGSEVWTIGTDKPVDLLVLIRTGPSDFQQYFLVETSLTGTRPEVKQVIPITARQGSTTETSAPKLFLPKPEHTAYVIFEDSVVLVATSQATSDPEAQLHDASYIQPENFEDAVYLRKNKDLAFLGAEAEEAKSGQASLIAFVQGAGLVRFSAHDSSKSPELSQIPVKSKIEQAVFYGMLQDNVLDLAHHTLGSLSTDEVEDAALAISDEILKSETPFIPTPPTSVEANLARRAQALSALATHLRQTYSSLSKSTMWKLLWDAEKIAAGQNLWQDFEKHLAVATSKGKKQPTLLHEISSFLQHLAPFELPDNASPDDRVRAMFVSRLAYIDKFLVWAHLIVDSVKNEKAKSQEGLLRLLSEADDVWLGVLETAYKFRTENAQLYNINPDLLLEGVLTDPNDYQGLDEFWTSSDSMLKEILKMTALSRTSAEEVYETPETEASAAFAKRIAAENPQFVVLICKTYQERINWTRSRGSKKYEEKADLLRNVYDEQRHDHIRALSGIGQTHSAMMLAEKYRDMDTLTEIIVAETQYLIDQSSSAVAEERTIIDNELEDMTARVSRYFNRFKDDWANAFFNEGFSGDQAGLTLTQGQIRWEDYLSRYLRADPSRAKMCWINDITSSDDYQHASQALAESAIQHEAQLWSKKVELSLAKLSMLAADESGTGHDTQDATRAGNVLEGELKIVDVQEKLYRHMLPEVLHALDQRAEVELAMERFGQGVKGFGMLSQLLEGSFAKLLPHDVLELEELIDAFTLIDQVRTSNPDTDIHGEEFYLALVALNAAAPELPTARFEMLMQLIWKRAFLTTDWASINKSSTSKRSGIDIEDLLSHTAAYQTLYLGTQSGLFDTSIDGNYVRALSPSECLGAACNAADLVHRFGDDLSEPIAHDNRMQDEKLDQAVSRYRINAWFEDCQSLANRTLEEEAAENAMINTQGQETEAEDGSVVILSNGNGVHGLANGGSNGLVNGVKIEEESGEGELFEGVDDEGDVEMA